MTRYLAFLLLLSTSVRIAAADQNAMLQFGGATMGTTYSVKVFGPPDSINADELRIDVDVVLRNVNDQMSTYLKSSEISRFNESTSTDWFAVSDDFAMVAETAQQVAAKTGGAFDITVGPLVNAWNFGPGPRSGKAPSQETLAELDDAVGFQKLSVRRDPPSLKKAVPGLRIDLSAIAKGHGVDRVVEFLNNEGCANTFVEIGGEVRTSGSKAGQWWKVGIQLPDAASDQWTLAHALGTGGGDDSSMATSGDYRNYFESDGVRYSHTIDPRTARPIEHALASVSVVTDRCMDADAWATAINVLGPEDGLSIAREEGLNALLISRQNGGFSRRGTGTLAQYADNLETSATEKPNDGVQEGTVSSPWVVLAITTVLFAIVLLAMAVGVIFGRKAISGSCGGIANKTNPDGSVACGLCSNPDDACKELRSRMQATESAGRNS